MTTDELNRAWYSESKVRQINVPNLTTWRSRYDLKEELLLEDYTLVKRNMRTEDMIPTSSSTDTYHIIEPGERYRPDIISYNFYRRF